MRITCYIFFAALLFFIRAGAQGKDSVNERKYNLNEYNGLPSNHVYCMLKDRHGYLWIGTDKGLVKYNGYNFKRYDINSGLQDSDVWDLHEDKKGRLWLYKISGELAYIYNDRYHKVHVKDTSISIIYPRYIRDYKQGIMFFSLNNYTWNFCVEYSDTLYTYKLTDQNLIGKLFISPEGAIFLLRNNKLLTAFHDGKTVVFAKRCDYNAYSKSQLINKFLLPHATLYPDTLKILDIENCVENEIILDSNEKVYNQYDVGKDNYIVTDRYIYSFGEDIHKIKKSAIGHYLTSSQLAGNRVSYFIHDDFWGDCISTTRTGMYMNYDLSGFHKTTPYGHEKFTGAGTNNNKAYYWNKETNTLAYTSGNQHLHYKQYSRTGNIAKMVGYGKDMLLLGRYTLYLLNTASMEISPLFSNVRYLYVNNLIEPHTSHVRTADAIKDELAPAIMDCIIKDSVFYCITGANSYCSYKVEADTLVYTTLAYGRYNGIVYDSALYCFFVYNDNNILIHKGSDIYRIREKDIGLLGIKKIKQLVVDSKFGNIFINDDDKLWVYNYYSRKFNSVRMPFHLRGAMLYFRDSTLLIAGKFGAAFIKTSGPLKLSLPVLHYNRKGLLYSNLFGIEQNQGKVVLNTDGGRYAVSFPGPGEYEHSSRQGFPFRLLVKHNDTVHHIHDRDTIWVEPKVARLEFDIINPSGAGSLEFQTKFNAIDSNWNTSGTGDVYLSPLSAGQFYTLSVAAHDDVWESGVANLTVYIKPYWWQTAQNKKLLGMAALILVLSILYMVIYHTRKIAVKAHIKKNYLLSLELKSIYAQINPHFIFNTLNTGLYFIKENKNEDAYRHISSFSQLLRSYLKSARNKYIKLAEEIVNLENYIRLQQSRFDDMFDYIIHVNNDIDADEVYIPALLLQPFVENAISHGLLNSRKHGLLKIIFTTGKIAKTLTCIIDDNGIGRQESKRINLNRQNNPGSYGTKLIEDLIKVINTGDRMKVYIEYKDKVHPETGTVVIITIKDNSL